MSASILILKHGVEAIVDAEDLVRAKSKKWRFDGRYVAAGFYDRSLKKICGLLLHRFLIDAPKGKLVDHIDGNTLNNQKSNLRLCDNRQNQGNQHGSHKSYSNFRGIHWVTSRSCWQAQIRDNGKLKWLGYFKIEEEAARTYDAAAKQVFGEFANLNFPEKK